MTFAGHMEMVDRACQVHLDSVEAIFRPEHEDPLPPIKGMFDSRYVLPDRGETGVEQTTPALFVRLADLVIDPENDNPTITIVNDSYRIRERHRDGMGGILFLLHRIEDC